MLLNLIIKTQKSRRNWIYPPIQLGLRQILTQTLVLCCDYFSGTKKLTYICTSSCIKNFGKLKLSESGQNIKLKVSKLDTKTFSSLIGTERCTCNIFVNLLPSDLKFLVVTKSLSYHKSVYFSIYHKSIFFYKVVNYIIYLSAEQVLNESRWKYK